MAIWKLGGAGFLFTVKDKLSKGLDGISAKFTTLNKKFEVISSGAARMGGTIATSMGKMGDVGRRTIGGVTSLLDQMGQRANSPKIDNAFSSMNATFAKTYGEITVGMNMSAKESNKWRRTIGSNAFALNADMDQTAKSWAEFRKQGIKLTEAVGGKGMGGAIRNLIKITATMGIEGQQLALMFSGLVKGFGFTTRRARALIDTVFKMGKAFNVGREMTQEMPGILQAINKELADFGVEAKPEDIEKMTISIVKLGIGLKESLGMNAKDATATAKNLFSTLLGERRNIIDMFRGMGGEFSEIAKVLAEKGGVGKALKMILQDPAKFMDALREMAKKTQKEGGQMSVGFQRLIGGIAKILGPDVTFAMKGNWDKARAAMKKLGMISSDTTKNLGALSKAANKAYKSGRTAGDAFTIMLQMQEARIQKLTNPMLNVWIKEQKRGFDNFYGTLQGLAQEKGPIGTVTRRLLLMQRVGLSGLFSGMGGAAPLLLQSLQKMGPMLSAVSALGLSLGALGKLLLPGGIIMVGLAVFDKGMREKLVGSVQKAFKFLKEKLPEWIPKIISGLKDLWYRAVDGVKWLMDVVAPLMSRLADAISKVDWAGLAQRLINFLGGMFRGVVDAIFGGSAFQPDTTTAEGRFQAAGAKLLGAMGRAMLEVATQALFNLGMLVFDWSDGFMESGAQKLKLIGGVFMTALFFGQTRMLAIKGAIGLGRILVTRMLIPTAIAMAAFVKGMIFQQSTMFAVMSGQLKWYSVQSIATWLAMSVKQAAIAYAGMVKTVGMFLWGLLTMNTALMKTAIKMAASWLIAMGPVGWVIGIIAAVSVAIYLMRDKIGDALGVVGEFFKDLGETIWDAITYPVKKLVGFVRGAWEKISGYASRAWAFITGESAAANQQVIGDVTKTAIDYAVKQAQMVEANYNATRDKIANAGWEATQVALRAGEQANTIIRASEVATGEQTKNFTGSASTIQQAMSRMAASVAGSWASTAMAAKKAMVDTMKMQRVALMAMGKSASDPVIQSLDERIKKLQATTIQIARQAKEVSTIGEWISANVKNQAQASKMIAAMADYQMKMPVLFGKYGLGGKKEAEFVHRANLLTAQEVKRLVRLGKGASEIIAEIQERMTFLPQSRAKGWAVALSKRATRASGIDPEGKTGRDMVEKYSSALLKQMLSGKFQGQDITKWTGQKVLQVIGRAMIETEKTGAKKGRRFTVPTGAGMGKGKPVPGKPVPGKPTGAPGTGFGPGGAGGGERKTLIDKDLSADTKKTMVSVGQAVDNLSQAVNSLQGRIKVDVQIYGDLRKFLKWQQARGGVGAMATRPTAG